MTTITDALTDFLEAASTAQKWRKVRAIESRLERDISKAFTRQGKAFSTRFAKTRSKFQEALADDDWVGIWDDVAKETVKYFLNPIQNAVQLSLMSAAEELIGELEVDYSFSLKNPRAVAYLEDHGAELVKGINATTRDYLKTLITEGVDGGWSYNRMAKAITDRFADFAVGRPQEHIESRAHLVAVTETGNAFEAGNAIVANDLKAAGLKMEKKWSTIGDDRVSDGCRENERAGWIALDEEFPSGDMHPLRFPGCRCTVLYRRARG